MILKEWGKWSTVYWPNGRGWGLYTSYVWARNKCEALELIRVRGLGETLVDDLYSHGYWETERLSYRLARLKVDPWDVSRGEALGIIHELTWISNLAVRSRVALSSDVLSDHGLLHNMVHYLQFDHGDGLPDLIQTLIMVEESIPGYLPKELK